MSPFYTRTGDEGYTGLLGKGRVPKYHLRTEALGTLDEANASLGMARAVCRSGQIAPILVIVQRDLYKLMAEVAATPENATTFHVIDEIRVNWLEEQTDSITATVSVPQEFIIPGDTSGGAALDLARTVVRRAERRVAELMHQEEVSNKELVRYLNRLSSLIFVLELLENHNEGLSTTLAKEKE
jgi:cob(I)alamin adenosyltransferase